jgi:hypothetical protein
MSIDPKEVAKKAHFWVTGNRFEIYGYCRNSRK